MTCPRTQAQNTNLPREQVQSGMTQPIESRNAHAMNHFSLSACNVHSFRTYHWFGTWLLAIFFIDVAFGSVMLSVTLAHYKQLDSRGKPMPEQLSLALRHSFVQIQHQVQIGLDDQWTESFSTDESGLFHGKKLTKTFQIFFFWLSILSSKASQSSSSILKL